MPQLDQLKQDIETMISLSHNIGIARQLNMQHGNIKDKYNYKPYLAEVANKREKELQEQLNNLKNKWI